MGIPATLSSVPATTPYIQYVATSGQTVFPYPFVITQDSDLVVVDNGVTYDTDAGYTVSGVGNPTGGNVTLNTGAAAGDIITLYRDIPIERLTQFAQNGGFSSTAFNAEFNNVYLLLQQLQQNLDQCLQIPNTNNPAPTVSLAPGAYANKYLAFDSNGNPTPAQLTSSGSLTQGIIAGLLTPQTAAEAAAGVAPVNEVYPELWVERYGADPTGTADSGVAFRSACLVAAQKGGGIIRAYGPLYNFTTWDAVSFLSTNNIALFCLPANTELAGSGMYGGTKLRISQTARTGMYNAGANRTHIIGMRAGQVGQYVHDLEFDWDGVVQASATDFCYCLRSMDGGCVLERLYTTQAPVTNGFALGNAVTASACVVRNCEFLDCGPNMAGNSINGDCSLIYNNCVNSVFENNRIHNTANAAHNCGGMEMHSQAYTVSDNYFNNLWPALYVGVQGGTQSTGSVVKGNQFLNSFGGISFVDSHFGLRITNNFFQSCADASVPSFADIYTPLNSTDGTAGANVQQGLVITDNVFERAFYRDGTTQGDAGSTSINLGYVWDCYIARNLFIAGTTAVQISGNSSGVNLRVSIEDNTLGAIGAGSANSGYFQILASSNVGWASCQPCTDIYIRRNKVLRDRALGNSTAFELVATNTGAGPSCAFTNVRCENNELTPNVLPGASGTGASSVTYTAAAQRGTVVLTLTGCTTAPTVTAEYSVANGVVTLSIPAISATSNSTSATLTGLPTLLKPTTGYYINVTVTDNSANAAGLISTAAGSGTLTLYKGLTQSSTTFTNTGTKGLIATTISYLIY